MIESSHNEWNEQKKRVSIASPVPGQGSDQRQSEMDRKRYYALGHEDVAYELGVAEWAQVPAIQKRPEDFNWKGNGGIGPLVKGKGAGTTETGDKPNEFQEREISDDF